MAFVVVSLAQRPDLVRVVAHWQWVEWGRQQGRRQQSVAREVARLTDPLSPEAGFVLLDNAVPVGTACLTVMDLDTRPDLSPWLASVFVVPEARRHGHAGRLVRTVEAAAAARGHDTLWLFTWASAPLYARLGWIVTGEEKHHGEWVTLMRRELWNGD